MCFCPQEKVEIVRERAPCCSLTQSFWAEISGYRAQGPNDLCDLGTKFAPSPFTSVAPPGFPGEKIPHLVNTRRVDTLSR